jgi:hypothetical protein
MQISRLCSARVLAPALAGLVAGLVLGPLQLSCGQVIEKPACAADQCPAGPTGPAGPAGPQGPSFGTCKWLYQDCAATPTECEQVCPAGTFPISGSCDAVVNVALVEHRASVAVGTPFPPSGSPFTAFDRWVCRSANGGALQFTYALCCAPTQ